LPDRLGALRLPGQGESEPWQSNYPDLNAFKIFWLSALTGLRITGLPSDTLSLPD